MKRGVLVVGSINMDLVMVAPRIPAPGEYVHAGGFRMVTGGKGANQAVASRRLGNPTWLLGRVGDDTFGSILRESLEADGVSTALVSSTPGTATGVALIVVEAGTGTNTIVVDPGANRALSVGDLDLLGEGLAGAGTALFQLEVPVDVSEEAARLARERGVLTILDSGPARRADISVVPHFDVISPNQPELAVLTGERIEDEEDAAAAAAGLLGLAPRMVVVKMGGSGSLLVEKEGTWHLAAYDVKCVDSTGAGDAFTAGLACALGEGMEPLRAVEFANAAGAVAVTAVGTHHSMPTSALVEELMESQRVKSRRL